MLGRSHLYNNRTRKEPSAIPQKQITKKKKMIRYMLDQTEMKTSQNRAYHTQNKVNKHNHHAKSVRVGNHNHNA